MGFRQDPRVRTISWVCKVSVVFVACALWSMGIAQGLPERTSASLAGTWINRPLQEMPPKFRHLWQGPASYTIILKGNGSYRLWGKFSSGHWKAVGRAVELYPEEKFSYLLQMVEHLDPKHQFLTNGKCVRLLIKPGPPVVLTMTAKLGRRGANYHRESH
jgi:hypothetical protein